MQKMIGKLPDELFRRIRVGKDGKKGWFGNTCIPIATITLILIVLLTDGSAIAQQQYQPLRYYTFDDPNVGKDQMNNSDLDFQYYGSGYTVNNNGPVNNYLTMSETGSLVKGGNIDLQREVTIEFLFKPGHNFNNTEFIRRRDKCFEIAFDLPDPSRLFPRMKFKTKYKDNSGKLVDDNMAIDFDGIGVKSWGYYTDGEWHHLVFKFNGNTGKKEIWVDGQLADGFSKNVPAGYMEPLGQPTELWFNNITTYRRLFGSIDEIAIYSHAIPASLIYKHYLEFQQGNHFSWIDDYTQPIPTADPVSAGIDINEYAPGHPNVNVDAMNQLLSFPTPRYKSGNTLIRNFQWFDPGKLAGYQTTNYPWLQIRNNVATIQKELAANYNYFLLVSGNTIDNAQYNDSMSLSGVSVKIANENPQWPASAITFWPQIKPNEAGFSSTQAYIKSQSLPSNYYLRNSNGQFISQWGGNTSTKFWSPAAPRNYNQIDGQTQKMYVQKLLDALTRPLDIINENAEVIPLYPESTMQLDPAVVADKNASGKNWTQYQGYAKARASIAYREEFMNLPGLNNTIFTEYGIDGQPTWRHDYSESRKINSQINGQYYATPDFYVRWPSNWRYWAAAWHGWQWIVDSRYHELAVGDKLYSPFVSAGWNNNPESNVRPAQWLGLLKALGATGAEFYYTGFFAETQPYQNPDNWVWQVVTPSYAQAITSRYEDILRNGHLMEGDVPAYPEQTNSKPGYSFYTGDYRKLVVIRKHDNMNKYAITGSIQPSNNMIGGAEQESDVKITLDGQQVQFNVRRQGSTYIYDNSNPSSPVFYQLDGWHEYQHPYTWSKDFQFEAELFDNTNSNLSIKTERPAGSANGDFRNYTSYLKFTNTGPGTHAEYNFNVRDLGQDYYLWIRARSVDGTSTGIDVELDNSGTKSIGCVDSSGWRWYRYDACNQQAIKFENLSKGNHTIKLIPLNNKIEIDQVLLSVNQSLILDPAPPSCSATIASISASGATTICTGDSVILTASQGTSYLWLPSGDTSRSITVKSSGSYSVLVGQGTGCSAGAPTEEVTVISSVAANISASGSTTICQGDSVTLTATSASSYLWSTNGETTQSITVTSPGSYSVMLTDSNGCTGNSPVLSISTYNNNGAQITANGPLSFCDGGSVILSAPSASIYEWSNGETTQNISVTGSGTYSVDLIYGSGCAFTSNQVNVSVLVPTPASISASGSTNFCQGGNVTLTANEGVSYLWNPGGQTSRSINVSQSGSFNVEVIDSTGCPSTSANMSVIVFPAATANISSSGGTSLCPGETVLLTANLSSAYQWSDGSTTQNINASNSGSYIVTVTNANGCTAISTPVQVNVGSLPDTSLSLNGSLNFCQGGSVTLSAAPGNSYQWSDGSSTQAITASAAGTYFVTITNSDGCTAISGQKNVNVLATPSGNITAGGPTNFCPGNSVSLSAPTGDNYLWMPNGETTNTISADTTGTYWVTVSNNNGCSMTSSGVPVTLINANSASISASGSTNICSGDSVLLTATEGLSYLWSDGQTTRSISVASQGSYTVSVSFIGGCTSETDPVAVIVNALPTANISAGGPTNFCEGNNVVLTADVSAAYQWSNGETTQSITVDSSGNYSVTTYNSNGCSKKSTTIPVQVTAVGSASIAASGSTDICQGKSVTLTASSGLSYQWSNGATSQDIVVSTSGSYQVTIDYGNGCSGTSPAVTINVIPLPNVTVSASGPTSFCEGGTVQLQASGGNSYYWFPTGATSANINVNSSGLYSVIATDLNGCSAISQNISVNVKPVPNDSIYQNGPTVFCEGGNVSLFASPGNSYQWSNGSTAQFTTIDSSGTFSATITNSNGCSVISNPVNVTVNSRPQALIFSPGGNSTCAGDSLILSAAPAVSYLWSNGQTTQNIYATTSATYTVTVTNNYGCTAASAPLQMTQLPSPSVSVTVNGFTSFCEGDSVVLTASNSNNYLWHPGGETTQSIVVKDSGQYYVSVVNSFGCTGRSQIYNVKVTPTPSVVISAFGPTTVCEGDTVQLSAPMGQGWLWSNGATTQSIDVTYTGNYVVTVIYEHGCHSVSPVQSVVVNRAPFAVIQASGPLKFCEGDSVVLTSNQAESHLWFPTGDTTQSITVKQAGSYRVQTSTQGCSNISQPITISVSPPESPVVTSNLPLVLGQGTGTIVLTSSASQAYQWYPGGQTTQSIVVTQPGTYYVSTGDSGVCMGNSDSVQVLMASSTFQANITSQTNNLICSGDSIMITASAGSSYMWFPGGQTSQSIFVDQPGTYYCVVYDTSGSGPSIASIQLNALQAPSAPDISSSFNPLNGYTLIAYEPTAQTYLWSTGASSASILVTTPGTYSVKAFNSIGCESPEKSITISHYGIQACVKPDMLQANKIGFTSAQLEWNPSIIADNFEVSYWISGTSNKKHITVPGNHHMLFISGLNPATMYDWTVKSICMSGLEISAVSSFNTLSGPLPCGSTPFNLSNDSITMNSAYCLWEPVTADNFVLSYKAINDTAYTEVHIPGTALDRTKLSGLQPGTTYQWSLVTKCSGITSIPSKLKYFTTLSEMICEGPKKINIDSLEPNVAVLSWDFNYYVDSLQVFFCEKGTHNIQLITVPGNPVPKKVKLEGLEPEKTYHVWIRSLCSFGKSTHSDVLTFVTPAIPGFYLGKDRSDPLLFNVYPVPVFDILNYAFYSANNSTYNIMIVDEIGKLMYLEDGSALEGENKGNINVQAFRSGAYIIKVVKDGKHSEKKFIKF